MTLTNTETPKYSMAALSQDELLETEGGMGTGAIALLLFIVASIAAVGFIMTAYKALHSDNVGDGLCWPCEPE